MLIWAGFYRKSSKFGISMSPEALNELWNTSSSDKSIVKGVRQAFYIVTAISPLLMLQPKKYHSAQGIRKDALAAVSNSEFYLMLARLILSLTLQLSMSLGNERPEFLIRVERSLWKSLLCISAGAPVLAELQVFLGAYLNLSGLYSGDDRHTNWFVGRKYSITPPVGHLD